MGLSASQPQIQDNRESSNEKRVAVTSLYKGTKANPTAQLSLDSIEAFRESFESNPKYKFATTVLNDTTIKTALLRRSKQINDQHIYSIKISEPVSPVTNQKSSGRCWLFATCNVLRVLLGRKLGIDNFQLSQSYLFFMDSLSKANYFLENMLDLVDEPVDSRLVQFLLTDPQGDGGQWDMAVNLVEEFGLVPQTIFPESFNSSNTRQLDAFLTSKLRQYASELRNYVGRTQANLAETTTMSDASAKRIAIQGARSLKQQQLQEVYRVLSITIGKPPRADEPFVWEYYDKNGKYHRLETTPKKFYKDHIPYDMGDAISLVNDPRNAFDSLYTVHRLGNVWGGRPVLYVNAQIDVLKNVAAGLLKADIPVWFGCDVGQSSDSGLGLMDTGLYDFKGAFDTEVSMSKADRLAYGESAMTHAMVLTGVHLDPAGKPVRWRVENSWGSAPGDQGYFLMTDEWFTEHVFQIVAPRGRVPRRLVDVFEAGNPHVLDSWDPLGVLA